jgi:hypothetical protein
MKPQLSSGGTILNAAVLTAADVVHKRVLCPACMEKEFERWPGGWDARERAVERRFVRGPGLRARS